MLKKEKVLARWYPELSEYMRREIGKWMLTGEGCGGETAAGGTWAERLMGTMEGEKELPPVMEVAFRGVPAARQGMGGDDGGAAAGNLMAVFYYQSPEAREKRVSKVVEDCLKVANR